jgi:2-methylcitrate dehydratase PrpD
VSNFCGVVAADLAESGFTGLDDGIALHLDRTARDGFQSDVLADRLGTHWELSRGYYKMHAAGRLTHPAIDGAARLQERYGFESDDVTSVRVETYEKAARWLGGTAPTNWLQAKSSVPFAVATRLVNESSGRAAFDESAFTEEVMDLTERVSVHADDELTSWVPERRSARVTVELATGERHSELVTHARGGAEDPYSETELRRKFVELVDPVLGDGTATTLWDAARNLPETTPKRMCRLVRAP